MFIARSEYGKFHTTYALDAVTSDSFLQTVESSMDPLKSALFELRRTIS